MKTRIVDCLHLVGTSFSILTLILRSGYASTVSSQMTSSTSVTLTPIHSTWDPVMCPNGCACDLIFSWILSRSLRTVNCSDLDLDLPPMNISADAEAIVLSGNRLLAGSLALLRDLVSLTELTIVGCHVHSLEDLVLGGHDWILGSRVLNADRNLLTQLHEHCFINLIELEFLVLSNNRIDTIHSNALAGLTRLTSLDLSGNRLTAPADFRWLCHVRHLRSVSLSANGITVIPNLSFRCLSLLETLDLSRNRIRHVDDDAFFGLNQLRHLSLEDNALPVVPRFAISQLNNIRNLSLTGNCIVELASDSFRSIATMTSLTLNRMSQLQLIDRWAFRNMTSLRHLEMRDNRRLKYIHPESFEGVRSLLELDLERSGVESIEESLASALPSLTRLNLRSVPLICDCVLSWLARKLANNETESGSGVLSVTDARCRSPTDKTKDFPVAEISVDQMGGSCGPRILPLFSNDVQVPMTDSAKLHCHAVGVPRPRSFWIPQSSSSSSSSRRTSQRNSSDESDEEREELLQLESVSMEDEGRYRCQAISPRGQEHRDVFLRVLPLTTSVVILRLTSTSITVTWKGTDHARDYSLTYRKLTGNVTSAQTIHIKHYMRSFTASELPPETEFEFCIWIRQPTTNHFRSINCTIIATRNRKSGGEWRRMRSLGGPLVAAAAAVAVACGAIFFCLCSSVVCSVKTFDRTKRKTHDAASAAAAVDRMSEMFLSSSLEGGSNMASETYENEAAESAIFDDADLDEIRNTAYMTNARSP